MKNRIFIAFILNFVFAILEFFGGLYTSSIAILSDSLHDFGDALSIGISAFFEKKSKKAPDSIYTYGYIKYSVLSGAVMWLILLVGSAVVIFNSASRIINPVEVNHNGMIIIAVFGAITNLIATLVTHKGENINEKAVSFHLLEDALGWVAVLVGAVIIKFTSFTLIDPILSLVLALFILINAIRGIKEIADIFLEKVPKGINIDEVKEKLLQIEGVENIHHIHIRSVDGNMNCATLHAVCASNSAVIKHEIKKEMTAMGIHHTTVEIELLGEECHELHCHNHSTHSHHHHHHH